MKRRFLCLFLCSSFPLSFLSHGAFGGASGAHPGILLFALLSPLQRLSKISARLAISRNASAEILRRSRTLQGLMRLQGQMGKDPAWSEGALLFRVSGSAVSVSTEYGVSCTFLRRNDVTCRHLELCPFC